MASNDLSIKYVTAQGPEGLTQVLDSFLQQSNADADFATSAHYVMYQLGNQRSLIKVDMSKKPYRFWYFDLLGRPATRTVKDTIADFLWEKGGEKERYEQVLASRE